MGLRLTTWSLLAGCIASMSACGGSSPPTPTHFSLRRAPNRAERKVAIAVSRGACVSGDDDLKPDKYSGASVTVTPHAYVVTVRMRKVTEEGGCAGVGLADFAKTVTLPGPLGDRALVSGGGQHGMSYVVVPPLGAVAIREIVDQQRHPGTFYVDPQCRRVARAFRGLPKSRWCAGFF